MIELNQKLKKELQHLLEIGLAQNNVINKINELNESKKKCVIRIDDSSNSFKQFNSQTGDRVYSSNNKFEFRRPKYNEEGQRILSEIQRLQNVKKQLELEYSSQLERVANTFLCEYKLLDKHANVLVQEKQSVATIYHSTGVLKRDLKDICNTLIGGDLHPGRFTANAAGIAMYWGNYDFFAKFEKNKPDNIIKAEISPDSKIHYITENDWKNFNIEFYKQYFNEDDFKLLSLIEENELMHVRSIFDVAMGFDASVRIGNDGKSEIWAIYNRNILQLEVNPIKNFDDIFNEEKRRVE